LLKNLLLLAGKGIGVMEESCRHPGHPSQGLRPLRFAVISDTHVNVTSTQSTTWLTRVYAAIARRDADFILHCGDITDTGQPDEYARYRLTLPGALEGRVHYSPGNHDVRWDPTAKELYHAHFGPAPYSFDAGGVHFIGFDPTEVLQEPGHYGPAGLAWLDADLRGFDPEVPVVLFQHFPFGPAFYYVDDQPAVLAAFARYNLRGIFAGHIHREDITRFNGLTQVAVNAVLNGPVYYWAERAVTAGGVDAFQVSRVVVAADGTQTQTPLATVPLAGPGPGRPRPREVRTGQVSGGSLPVTVITGPHATPQQVGVHPYPQPVFGGTCALPWQPLARQPLARQEDRWSGTVDVSALPPGRQRLQVRVLASDGSWWEDVALFTVPGSAGDPVLRWCRRLPGSVQGGIALAGQDRGAAVAASTAGEIAALHADGGEIWRSTIGPVYRQPGVNDAGDTLFVPSADHCLYALDASTGRTRWLFDAGAPVLSAPAIATVAGREQVLFSAGQALFAVDAQTGRQLWTVPDRGFSSGQAACDGDRVYTAAADGYARAHDAVTGGQLWAHQMVTGSQHHIDLYSGWDNVVALGGGTAITATVSSATALATGSGARLWQITGSTMYPPALTLPSGTVLLTTEYGVMTLADLTTGATIWQTSLNIRVFNAGVITDGDMAWVLSADGELIGVRLADGRQQCWLQHSLAYTFSRPAITAGTLIAGDQNGHVHGITLAPAR
jgi:outer membrane protein assembly factor BamB/3',5'-cyclic AMP phosphodiesterase CpdA